MTLPTPRLDDRTFQQLVDEAKLYVQRRCPEWTDHNVSDPGVTLIETFAWMTDMLLYRVNRVPDHLRLRFLELLGVQLYPPRAAQALMSFRLSSHQDATVRIPVGTTVSTQRSASEDAISFTTRDVLHVVPATSDLVATMGEGGELVDRTPSMGLGEGFHVFSRSPAVGDTFYVRLDQAAPSNILLIQVVATVGGHGIDPTDPPYVWEASTPSGWRRCPVGRDSTLGLNTSGSIDIHLPHDHGELVVAGSAGSWVRCRIVDSPTARPYRSSPELQSVTAATIGGDVDAVHAERVRREPLGVSDGTSGQRFVVQRPPVLPNADVPFVLEVGAAGTGIDPESGWTAWELVDDFAESGPGSRHVTVDRTTGEIRFGPVVRQADGTVRHHGAVPPRGAPIRAASYGTGGGAAGNVTARSLSVLGSSIPYVAAVYNREAAHGGVDGESVDEAVVRGPLELRRRRRAVTTDDYVTIAREAAPELARVYCIPDTAASAGAVRVLVVPHVDEPDGRIALADLRVPAPSRERVQLALDEARVIGTRISIEPPSYVGVRVDAVVRARYDADVEQVERETTAALYRYFNPFVGGPDGAGWPLGRPVQRGEVYSVIGRVAGVDYVDQAALFRADPRDGSFTEPADRIDLADTHLALSVEHLVSVTRGTA